MDYIIKADNLAVRLNNIIALEGVSFTLKKGEFAALIGPNGAGKTTLVKTILGLIKPDFGTIEVFGKSPSNLGDVKKKIGYVPQVYNVDTNFPISVFDLVIMGTYGKLGIGKRPSSAEKESSMKALGRVGIADLANRPIAKLSGGQRQRAFIARALVNNPELLLLDEPSTGVDYESQSNLYSMLLELKNDGVSIVVVSHDIGVVASYADTVFCVNRSLVCHGRPEEVLNSEALRRMYGCDVAFFHHGKVPHIVVEDHNC
ncbi:MAG: metal ABC transporter ATP-binding protein [Armatimonadota bacterium]